MTADDAEDPPPASDDADAGVDDTEDGEAGPATAAEPDGGDETTTDPRPDARSETAGDEATTTPAETEPTGPTPSGAAAGDGTGAGGSAAGSGSVAQARTALDDLFAFEVRMPESTVARALIGIAALALVARLFLLGQRIFHWDEGRVAYWILKYGETGFFEYRPIVHGPFLFHVDKWLFWVFGPSDFVARLPVAVVGALMPLSAWLFRERLRDSEMVAMGALLAVNPLLLYYSRFMRNDVLVAGFMLFALGFFVRAMDTKRTGYLYAAAAFTALGFTAKENALLYLVCFVGAFVLIADHHWLGLGKSRLFADDGTGDGEGDAGTAATDGGSDPPGVFERIFSTGPRRLHVWAAFFAASPVVLVIPDRMGMSGLMASSLVSVGSGWLSFELGFGDALALVVGLVATGAFVWLVDSDSDWHYLPAIFLGAVPVSVILLAYGAADVIVPFSLSWLLAFALLLDERLFPRRARRSLSGLAAVPPMLVAFVVFFGVIVFFFAPRAGAPGDIGLWKSLTQPTMIPDVLNEAVVGSWEKLYEIWIEHPRSSSDYTGRLEKLFRTFQTAAIVVGSFGVVGFVLDWIGDGPRDLVSFAGYWGFASVLGYPFATDIWAPWVGVHAVVPLAIPAAVGIAFVYRVGRSAVRDDQDYVTGAVAAVILILLAVPTGVIAADVGYMGADDYKRTFSLAPDTDDPNQYMMQWAQPGNDLKDTLGTVEAIAQSHEGTDVVFYGTKHISTNQGLFYVPDEDLCLERPPVHEPLDPCNQPTKLNWHSRLPLPWYMEMYGAEVASTPPEGNLSDLQTDEIPPVIFSYSWERNELERQLPEDYESHTHDFKLFSEHIIVFVDPDAKPT